MICRVVLPLFLLSLSAPTVAQDTVAWERFFPYQVGDLIQYHSVETSCDRVDCSTFESYRTFRVSSEMEIGGDVFPVFESGTSQCAVGVPSGEDWFVVHQLQGSNCLPIDPTPDGQNLIFTEDEPYAPVVITVDSEVYEVDAAKEFSYGIGSGGRYWGFASDVGLVRHVIEEGGTTYSLRVDYDVVYAEIGGNNYGVAPVDNEYGAAPSAFALGTPYPNPFYTSTTLALSLSTAEPVTVDVFDVLGRRVLQRNLGAQRAGTSQHAIDLSATPAGVYFVRVTTASGQSATQRIVRVE